MNDLQAALESIGRIVKGYYESRAEEFIPGRTQIPLMTPSFDWREVNEVIDSLLSSWVTMGKKVRTFEEAFSKYIGVKEGVMVNSGSSANLLALSILTNPGTKNRIRRREEIITPALTWVTTVYPMLNVNAMPVIVDCDLESYNISPDAIEEAITERTRAIMPVHLIGNPCDMKRLSEIADRHDLYLVEDSCEAHGAEFDGRRVGSFGDLATFSFFFSHHMTTIEGGMVVTDNEEYSEMARALRAFGWIRDMKKGRSIAKSYEYIDPRFLFINIGFNVRPTDLQGGMGLHQLAKLDGFIEDREENADYWNRRLKGYEEYLLLPRATPGGRHAWFQYPLTIKPGSPFTKGEIVRYLEDHKVETRPLAAGNIARQPVARMMRYRVSGTLRNSDYVMDNGFVIGNHSGIGRPQREYVADLISGFIDKKKKKRR